MARSAIAYLMYYIVLWTSGKVDTKGIHRFPRIALNLSDVQLENLKKPSHIFSNALSYYSAAEIPCGQRINFTDRIVGGIETNENEFPWQAWLVISYHDERFGCGGSLINDQWVLTAAHCIDGALEVQILLGSHHKDLNVDEPNRRVYTSESFFIHPNWDDETLAGDVALIQLPSAITFDDYVRPICLVNANDSDHINDLVMIAGWGISFDGGTTSPVLRKAQVTVINNTNCQKIYGDIITDDIICTDGTEGHGTCDGDSGGSVSYVGENGIFHQIGIISFGSSTGCESRQPDGHSRIKSYFQWISNISSISHSPKISPCAATIFYSLFFGIIVQLFFKN